LKMRKLEEAADTILNTCMGLNKDERFLVIYDRSKEDIANVLLERARRISNYTDKVKIPIAKIHGEEPPSKVAKIMKEYDVIVIVTKMSLSHTKARRDASRLGVRIVTMPGITKAIMIRTLTANYYRINKTCQFLYNLLKNRRKLRLITALGTDVIFHINKPFKDTGLYRKKGSFGNLPAGEVGFAPVENKTNGTIVIDKTMAGIGKLRAPIRLEIEGGFVKRISGKKEANRLIRLLKKFNNRNVYNIAEFAIGTNYKAKVTGITLEDEKAYGTVHIALGDNTSFPGGKTKAPIHLDGIISKPTILLGSKAIIKNGILNPKVFK